MVGRDLHAQQRKDAGEQQAQHGGDEWLCSTKAPRRRASLPVGAGASGAANAKTRGAMRSRAMLAQAQPVRMALVRMSITKASGSFWATRPMAPQMVKKDLAQAEGDAPSKSALGDGARLCANGLGLAQNK